MDFTKVTVYTNSNGVNMVCAALYDLDITGVEIMDREDFDEFMKNNLRAWDVVDEELLAVMSGKETTVTFYLENDDRRDVILAAVKSALDELKTTGDYGRLNFDTTPVRDEDWANNWKKFYKPLRIGEHILIKPSWEDVTLLPGDKVVELDPGMAFGTGSHASTAMCLCYLEKLIRPGDTVLDIGTGSGILGIAALKLGAKSVTAVDIDPLAVSIARENAEKNGYGDDVFKVSEGDLADRVTGCFDVVIANIVADIICELSESVCRYIKPSGHFVTSGIIDFKADKVRDALGKTGLTILDNAKSGDWNAFLLRRD